MEALVSSNMTGTLPSVVAQAIAAISLGLLAASGVAKITDPTSTTGAMRQSGLPSSNLTSRGLGLVEIVVSVSALVVGGPIVFAAALLYVGFGVFAGWALANRLPIQSCGCFGRSDTPPSRAHVVFNAVAALALIYIGVAGLAPIDWGLPMPELLLYMAYAVAGVYGSYLLLALLPSALRSRATT